MYEVGLSGIPVFNVNNNCSTGSTALMLAKQAVEGGSVECALALGFEKMEKGALKEKYEDRENPVGRHAQTMVSAQGFVAAPPAAQMFGGAGREYRWKYGTKRETFAKVSEKARKHASNNPYALFNQVLSVDEILASEEVFDPLTRYQCCPPTCGAAARAVVCSSEFAKKHGHTKPVWIAAQAMSTDYASSFQKSMIKMVGYDMTASAASKVYEEAGLGPQDVQVCELHDCFTANEVITLRGARPLRGEAEPRSSSGRARTPTAARSSPTRPVGSCRRGTPSAQRASRSAPSSYGSCAAAPTSARCRGPGRPAAQPRPGRRLRRHDVPGLNGG